MQTQARGSIETLPSGSLRVRVYAGVDVLTGRQLYLPATMNAGPQAAEQAEKALTALIDQVHRGRHPRTSAPLTQLIEAHLTSAELAPNTREALEANLRRYVAPTIGDKLSAVEVTTRTLEVLYAGLRRCRWLCSGKPYLQHRTDKEHRCTKGCKPHVCQPLAAWTSVRSTS